MLSQLYEEAKYLVAGLAALAVGGIGLWRKASRARADTSGDTLITAENTSKADWLDSLETRLAVELRLREAAEARERDLFARFQRVESELRLCAAQGERQERRYRRLVDLVSETRPELREWLLTEPAGLHDDTTTTKGHDA